MSDKMPPLPEMSYLGQLTSYGYEACHMQAYARAYAAEQTRELVEALERISKRCPTHSPSYTVASVGDIAREALAKYKARNEPS